jgi:hypothetical protein
MQLSCHVIQIHGIEPDVCLVRDIPLVENFALAMVEETEVVGRGLKTHTTTTRLAITTRLVQIYVDDVAVFLEAPVNVPSRNMSRESMQKYTSVAALFPEAQVHRLLSLLVSQTMADFHGHFIALIRACGSVISGGVGGKTRP